ncbi:unnamed protein product [Phyllotreta striolata]|uniref:Cytochrome P450 n=1 Tax=Phyllotreta striolata TaxID=444603 RepID=A0A9N9TMK5_PHYSR|nr:unnamed protein product [Phyllotreta striolata]
MLQLILIAICFAALFYYFGVKPMYHWTEKGINQTTVVWLAGDNWRTVFKLESFAEMVKRVYMQMPGARYLGMYQFTTPTLVLRDPELIKQIGVKDFDHFVDHRSFVTEESDPLFGKNLFSLKGQRWREMRPILSPSFTSSKMKNMFTLMSDCATSLTDYFSKKNQEVVEVEMKDVFTRYTNDVIATTAFGISIDSLKDQTNEFYLMGKQATNFGSFWQRMKFFGFFLAPKLFTLLKIPLFDKEVAKFFTDLINNNIKMRKEKGIVRPDMINLLLEAQKGKDKDEENHHPVDNGFATVEEADFHQKGKSALGKLTNMDIVAQAMIFFFAGFDTVSSVMCFMAYELAIDTDVQKRLREEVFQTLDECKGTVTYEAVLKMKYMDMVVSETLRKWPSAIAVDRVCTKPYTIEPVRPDEKPLHVDKGDILWLPIFGIHHDPEIYPDPERFDPERFNDDNKANIHPYSYIPFGVGPRNCIGNRFALMEIKVVFFHLLSLFEVVPIAKTEIPLRISKAQFNLQAEGGFPLGLKRLSK